MTFIYDYSKRLVDQGQICDKNVFIERLERKDFLCFDDWCYVNCRPDYDEIVDSDDNTYFFAFHTSSGDEHEYDENGFEIDDYTDYFNEYWSNYYKLAEKMTPENGFDDTSVKISHSWGRNG